MGNHELLFLEPLEPKRLMAIELVKNKKVLSMEKELVEKLESLDGTPATIINDELGIEIKFQLGPVKLYGENGCHIQDVLIAAADSLINGTAVYNSKYFRMNLDSDRLEKVSFVLETCIKRISALNTKDLACRENAIALTSLETARMWAEAKLKTNMVLLSISSTEDMIYLKIMDAVLWLEQRRNNRYERGVAGTYAS
jgi:hypothetical protein